MDDLYHILSKSHQFLFPMCCALKLCRLMPKLGRFTQSKPNNLVRLTQKSNFPNITQTQRKKRGKVDQTSLERIKCLFSEAKLSNSFWAEVFNIVVYVMNLSPAIVLDYDVPNRVWFAKDFL